MDTLKYRFLLLLLCTLASVSLLRSQDDATILFYVAGKPVTVGEFRYIYTKTNGAEATFSRASLQEYLDLYIKFKLKVAEAKTLRIEQLAEVREELVGYRRQLSDSYILNREVTGKLVRELFDRSREDVDISHILYPLSGESFQEDSVGGTAFLADLYLKLQAGADFEDFARNYSLDRSSKTNSGHIGFINVPFPNGFYDLETAAYAMAPGEIRGPIVTPAGLHLLKVNARRPARGEVEGAHILLRKAGEGENPFTSKTRIDSIHSLLQSGQSFEKLAMALSEDDKTASKGGYIGVFGINRFEESFEEAIFNLEKDGDYSAPVQTNLGWHILKRISRKMPLNFEAARPILEAAVRQDQRYTQAREGMFSQIRRNAGFTENRQILPRLYPMVNDTFYTFRWKAPELIDPGTLFTLGGQARTLADFTAWLEKASRTRYRLSQEEPVPAMLGKLYDEYLEEETLRHEEGQLEAKYPEFRHLLREYEEGILLFEVTRQEVWDKASQDTTGLAAFFKLLEGKYNWDERAQATRYVLKASSKERIAQIRDYVRTRRKNEVLVRFNQDDQQILSASEVVFEKGKSPEANLFGTSWKAGQVSTANMVSGSEDLEFYKIEKVLPAGPKKLEEAKGYVIADYQDYLEKEWVDTLRKKYDITIAQQVLEALVKP